MYSICRDVVKPNWRDRDLHIRNGAKISLPNNIYFVYRIRFNFPVVLYSQYLQIGSQKFTPMIV